MDVRVQAESGEVLDVPIRRRIRDEDLLLDRDILMLVRKIQGGPGSSNKAIGRVFGISGQLVGRRLDAIPPVVEKALRKVVQGQVQSQGFVLLGEQQQEQIRAVLKRARRGKVV